MSTFLKDLQYGLRTLSKAPTFTGVTVLTLALAIGANTIIFSIVSFLLLRPLPFDDPGTIGFVYGIDPQRGTDRGNVSFPDYIDWRDQNRSFDQLAALTEGTFTLTGPTEPIRVFAYRVTSELLTVWGFDPILGRTFVAADDAPGVAGVVVLSHGFWTRQFDADPAVVGTTVGLNGAQHTVVGVLEPDAEIDGLSRIDVWAPLGLDVAQAARDERTLRVAGRLKSGVTLEQATADIQTIARRLEETYPVTNTGWNARVASLWEGTTGPNSPLVLTLLGLVVTFVLLIACANVANLMLARVVTRRKEMALRVAIGAGRFRRVRQLVTESLVLGLLGGGAGLLVARFGLDVIRAFPSEPIFQQIVIDYRVLLFTAVLSLVAPLLCALAPAIQASRTDLNDSLKETSTRTAGGRRGRRGRNLLVVSQVALAVTMLVVAGLSVRTALAIQRMDLGFDTAEILTLPLTVPEPTYPTDAEVGLFYTELVERLEQLPGIEAAGVVGRLPIVGGRAVTTLVTIEGRGVSTASDQPWADRLVASPDYLRVMNIPLLAGRAFSTGDRADTGAVVLISQEMARRHWPDADPLGHRIKLGEPGTTGPWREIVGVIRDTRGGDLAAPPQPQLYVPATQQVERGMVLVARATGDPTGLVAAVRGEIREADADQAVYDVQVLAQIFRDQLASDRLLIGMFVAFAVVALLLAATGLYGVMSYSVSQRTKELGIRLALGAQPGRVLRMVVGQGLRLAGTGVALGLGGGLLLGTAMSSILYEVGAGDPPTYAIVCVVLATVALLTSYVPARRAMRLNPLDTLRLD